MKYIILDKTDARVSRIALGTASLHHVYHSKSRQRLLATAWDLGISHFDTSPYYGHGLSEAELGSFIPKRRDLLTVTTKIGLYPRLGAARTTPGLLLRKALGRVHVRLSKPIVDWGVQRASQSFNASLRRLKTDYVDFLLLHEPNIAWIDTDEFLMWVEDLQQSGRVRYWGLAGVPELLEPWLQIQHPLSWVLQTRDDILTQSADFIFSFHKQLQFTYGYLSSKSQQTNQHSSIEHVVSRAMMRNNTGSILFSTCDLDHLVQLARCCE